MRRDGKYGQTNASLSTYGVAVVDVGSPKLGNLGWSAWSCRQDEETVGTHLDPLADWIAHASVDEGLLLGLEAPLFVPIREDLLLATKARSGENPRPWSAGAGAQVLALNLPIMVYLFTKLRGLGLTFCLQADAFTARPREVLLFEALVSGRDKGSSHIEDAAIMTHYCQHYAQMRQLPPTQLKEEVGVRYFNLAACALRYCDLLLDDQAMHAALPIYKPEPLP